jgi:deoxycytidylate deaminase
MNGDFAAMSAKRTNGELVFALISPVGTDYGMVADHLRAQLFSFGYECSTIRLSQSIATYCKELGVVPDLVWTDQYERIKKHMHEANVLYRRFNEVCDLEERNALFALHAITEIQEQRIENNKDLPLLNKAHVILTLKRPEEVTYLRRIYGLGLHVISVFSPEEDRIAFLMHKQHLSKEKARVLINDDENDSEPGGQRTGEAFHLADLFIDTGEQNANPWGQQIDRYLELLFSHPFRTPTRDEQAMFMAFGASLRSAQLGRQVGASIANSMGEVMAIGCNEVPSPTGGQYWEGDADDKRDHVMGSDSNDCEKWRIYNELLQLLPADISGRPDLKKAFRGSSIFGITEFGRAVHAEMEALLSCARRGVSTRDTVLYTTTFPCHNCARHIVGAGVRRVVYIEPYPKSKATILHEDAITWFATERTSGAENHVEFTPFVGISPRRYGELFTILPTYGREVVRKNRETGNAVDWRREEAELRFQMYPISYIEREELAVERLGAQLKQRTLPFTESNMKES